MTVYSCQISKDSVSAEIKLLILVLLLDLFNEVCNFIQEFSIPMDRSECVTCCLLEAHPKHHYSLTGLLMLGGKCYIARSTVHYYVKVSEPRNKIPCVYV